MHEELPSLSHREKSYLQCILYMERVMCYIAYYMDVLRKYTSSWYHWYYNISPQYTELLQLITTLEPHEFCIMDHEVGCEETHKTKTIPKTYRDLCVVFLPGCTNMYVLQYPSWTEVDIDAPYQPNKIHMLQHEHKQYYVLCNCTDTQIQKKSTNKLYDTISIKTA